MAELGMEDTVQWNWKELFCLFCWPPCPRVIASKLAFMPPISTYLFKEDESGDLTIWPNLESMYLPSVPIYQNYQDRFDCYFARSSRGNNVACVFIKCRDKTHFSILFSHGNAVDIGQILDFYKDLSTTLKCNILVYDYSGFGQSTGKPTEKNMYADINAAWVSLRQRYHIPPEKIILFGQSIGTVPSVDLSSRQLCAGVILQSPLTSGLRLVFPNWKRGRPFDVFNNLSKVHRIRAPVLVIHGTDDTIIDVSHGMEIQRRCRVTVNPLWVRGGGHNNLEMYPQFLERLRHFVNRDLFQYRAL